MIDAATFRFVETPPAWLSAALENAKRGRRAIARGVRNGVVSAELLDLGQRLADAEQSLGMLANFFREGPR